MEACCDGLLCFSKILSSPTTYYICNPVTKSLTSVSSAPSLNEFEYYLQGFYFHHSTGEYRLLQYFRSSQSASMPPGPFQVGYEVATVNRGQNNPWRRIYGKSYPDDSDVDHVETTMERVLAASRLSKAIIVNGNLHWLPYTSGDGDFGILVFDTESESFRHMSIPDNNIDDNAHQFYEMNEMNGNLYFGRIPYTIHEVNGERVYSTNSPVREMELWVLKDYKRQHWVKLHTIISYKGIGRSPEEVNEDGELLMKWRYRNKVSLYNFKRQTSKHIRFKEESSESKRIRSKHGLSVFLGDPYSLCYTESLVSL